jgi:hypothetical protein
MAREHWSLTASRTTCRDELDHEFHKALDLYKTNLRRGAARDAYHILNLMANGDRLTLARNLEQWSSDDLQALRAGRLCLVFLPGEVRRITPKRSKSVVFRAFVASSDFAKKKKTAENGVWQVSVTPAQLRPVRASDRLSSAERSY